MHLNIEWEAVPLEGDPLECRSWARLVWSAGSTVLTRVYDRTGRSERDGIYVPLFPLARWIVTHWWSLLYEPWPFSEPIPQPGAATDDEVRAWLRRHCARAALPGFASPFACLFSQGVDLAIVSRADPRTAYPQTGVAFTETAEETGDREDVKRGLAEFVGGVLGHLDGFDDPRVTAMRADWQAICAATPAEAEFCRAAGRLGLDPHDADRWPAELLQWFESSPSGALDSPLVADLLETPDPAPSKPAQHHTLAGIVQTLGLGPAAHDHGPSPASRTAFGAGYSLAAWIRREMQLSDDLRLDDLDRASEAACGRALVVRDASPIPEGRVLALVGWRTDPSPIAAIRGSGSSPSRSFLRSRALYMAMRTTTRGPRLVTDARTWDQRASRAFAAELLAPRAGVRLRFDSAVRRFGRDEAELHVADHYGVSPMIIRHQLDNSP